MKQRVESPHSSGRRIATKLQQWRQFVRLVATEKQISQELQTLLAKAVAVEKPEQGGDSA